MVTELANIAVVAIMIASYLHRNIESSFNNIMQYLNYYKNGNIIYFSCSPGVSCSNDGDL